jgi:hypothetical protein
MSCAILTLAVLSLGVLQSSVIAQTGDDVAIARAIERLGSSSFAERSKASRELDEIGLPAFVPLAKAAMSEDSEIRTRARAILERHAAIENKHLSDGALAAAEQAAKGNSSPAAREMVTRVRDIVRRRSIALLKTLGLELTTEGNAPPTAARAGLLWTGRNKDLAMLQQFDSLTDIGLASTKLDHETLDAIVKIQGVRTLVITQPRVATRLERLNQMKSLEYLSLAGAAVKDSAIRELPVLPRLKTLGLDRTLIGDDALDAVAKQPALETLWLDGTQVTSAGLKKLTPLASLKTLRMEEVMQVPGEGLEVLATLPLLEHVRLKGTKLSVDDVERLAKIPNLIELGLDHTNVGDDHLEKLPPALNLRTLWLSKSAVTDVGLVHLHKMESLQKIYLHATSVTSQGVDELKRALPRCHVYAATETSQTPR